MPPLAHLLYLPLYAIAGVVSACLWAVLIAAVAGFVGWVLVRSTRAAGLLLKRGG